MKRPLLVIYATVVLDALGIGLIFPILPALLAELTHRQNIAPYVGTMIALYAVMQFIFAPVLGALSDRLGRRPVLMISLAGAAINYLFMALAPSLWMLFLGRAIAGLSSANVSVASAYISDVSPPKDRPRRFGLLNAMFGAGFIIGPVLGGLLGDYWLRLPFIIAAALSAGALIFAAVTLPHSPRPHREKIDLAALNPLRPLRWAASMKNLRPILLIFCLFSAAGEAYGTCWALWGEAAFQWNGFWIGLSLGVFGLCQTLVQALLPARAVRLFGEKGAILIGLGCAILALIVMAFATAGWVVFAIMPIFALGGLGTPTLQALASRQVSQSLQGQFQGVIASSISLATIFAPLGFSSAYFLTNASWPGAIWLSVAGIFALGAVLILGLRFGPTAKPAPRRPKTR